MGVESMRARTARQAEQVIRSQPIHIAVVDLGLPLDAPTGSHHHPHDEAGCRVLELLRRLDSPPPTVIVRSTRAAREATRDLNAALRFDAFAVVDRTSADVELMLKILQRCLERFYQGRWPDSLH
jgi:DNA-binding NarL/FixJ family response regulator